MFQSKRLERNGSRNQTSSLTQSFGPFGIFELAFQCHRSEVNQHPVTAVMPVLLKGGQSTPSSSLMAELDRPCDQLGVWPSRIVDTTSRA
ncbi:hypothetical protein F2Q68_00039950 [Brassica cretica]|uniref:Uncharacterized protein n=1 Tax=Brassica cretica TaxID=69181 RepID=A0A8S9MGM7_BRACR|nr:hypothetical protein F2Q68_00039950 [Brassica cretica]